MTALFLLHISLATALSQAPTELPPLRPVGPQAPTGDVGESLPPPRPVPPTATPVPPTALPFPDLIDPQWQGAPPPGPGAFCPPEPPLELVEFRELPLEEALQLLCQQSQLRAVASVQAGRVPVTAALRDVGPLAVVESLARANNLYLRRDCLGIITINTAAEHQADLASFREEQTEVFTLLYPNAFDVGTAIRDLYGPQVRLTYGEDDGNLLNDLRARFDRFDLVDSRSNSSGLFGGGVGGFGVSGISGVGGVGGTGGTSSGLGGVGGTGGVGSGIGSGVGLGTGIGAIGGIGAVGQPGSITGTGGTTGTQGNVAGGLGTGQSNFTIYVTVIRRLNQVVVRTSDPKAMANIVALIHQLDVPTPLVLLEVKVLSLDLGEDFHSVFDYQFASDFLLAGGFTSGDILPPLANVGAPAPQRFQPISPQGTGLMPNDLIFQVVDKNFRFRMQMLEVHDRVTELATPILLTANNEVSRIFIGQTQPITVGFTPGQIVSTGIATANTISPTPITTLQDIGTQLLITPNINADRTVTLRITQQRSNVLPNGGTIPVPNTATGVIQNVQVDIVQRQTFSGTVVAKDGLTVAIGGLIEESLRDHREEPPILGKLPYIGFMFRRQDTVRTRTEHVILIRPYVFFTPVEAASLSRDLVTDLSAHPMAPNPVGSLNTFAPNEILRPDPPRTPVEMIFKVHFQTPKDF